MISIIIKYWNTVKYLKMKQVYYRLYYLCRKKYRQLTDFSYPPNIERKSFSLKLAKVVQSGKSFDGNTFTFLNMPVDFQDRIDWNYSKCGKLWNYNLNYFEYLQQASMDSETGSALVNDFINNITGNKGGIEPYPTSLRTVNWIKFFSEYNITDSSFDASLYAQYKMLLDNIECHLMGNHLLENGFSLLFGAYYFRDKLFYKKAKKILITELNEQILADGAHFELSPMYHQIVLSRVLDCVNLLKNNDEKQQQLLEFFIEKASVMLQWLNNISFSNGDIPMVNDSSLDIAPNTKSLNDYAETLGVKCNKTASGLSDSGYRKYSATDYELLVDAGNIGPDYLLAHAHSDTFNFVLHIKGRPVIIDTGISTYEKNEQRQLERSTASHNTVMIENAEQSRIWNGFRVAERAKVVILNETSNSIEAEHNGYKKMGISHKRRFECRENEINIQDIILSHRKNKKNIGRAYLHFHPSIVPKIENNSIKVSAATIVINNSDSIYIEEYPFANGFNKITPAKMVVILFSDKLSMKILI